MEQLIKKTSHRLGSENWILAYGCELQPTPNGKWKRSGSTIKNGKKFTKYECVALGSECTIGSVRWDEE